MINFEKIKNMSLEKMANTIGNAILDCAFCPICNFCDRVIGGDARSVNCIKVWMEWLKSEVEE